MWIRAAVLVIALTLVVATGAAAAELATLQKLNLLENVTADGDGCGLRVAINDRAGFDGVTVETKGREVHVTFPRTYTHPPMKLFSNLGSPCFARVVAAQVDKQTVRAVAALRDSYKGEMEFHYEAQGGGVRIASGPKPVAAAPAAEVAAETAIPEAKPDLATLLQTPAKPETAPVEPAPTPAPAAKPATLLPAADEMSWSKAIVKMIVALAVSLAILLILVGLAKRYKLPARLTGGRAGMIRVVQTGLLDMKRRIAVVDVAGELIVVALTNQGVTMLTKIESDAARRRLLGETENPSAISPPAAVEPMSFEMNFGQTADDRPIMPSSAFGAKLRAYTRHAPKESAAAGHETLKAIAERVKGLKRL